VRILIVDDEKNIRRALTLGVESMGHDAVAAAGGAAAIEELKAGGCDAVFLDLKLSQESGLDVLQEILRVSPRAAVVMVAAYASVETAVEAMRRGAFDYLPKPCTPEQVRQVLARIEKTRRLERRVLELESRLGAEFPDADLTTQSPAMQRALDVAFKAADSDATVLLLGESGTGKSVLARAMHERSPRSAGAFVTVSCPSLSRELLESDLFGHVKGAFTGAHTDTIGKVAAADGGTLFLDEIGEMPVEIQARLLRLLQEREYERVGETRPRRATSASFRRPTAISPMPSPGAGSVRICSAASTSSPSACRPCASGSMTSRDSPRAISTSSPRTPANPPGASRPRRSKPCAPTRGRGICANCAT
jgi:NtrC-family two-component system response regulator AlgB